MPSNIPGYLPPQSAPAPLEDVALEDFFHDIIVGLSGLDDLMVRPIWQGEPPTQPGRDENWIAFGLTVQPSDTYAVEVHSPEIDGSDELQRHETIEVSMMCYGANAGAVLRLLRDSIQVEQNREVFTQNGMGLQETTEIIAAPVLAKARWQRRFDMKMLVRRIVVREFEVLNILEADIYLKAQLSKVTIP